MNKNDFRDLLSRRILLLDGAMGTCLLDEQLTEEDYRGERFEGHTSALLGNTDILTLTRPELVEKIHRAYLDAGADILTTNTFNANRLSQKAYGLSDHCREMNRQAAVLAAAAAREASVRTGRPRFVAGSVGPTGKTLSFSPRPEDPGYREVTFEEVRLAYLEQIEGLLDGGADLILVETVFDTLVARAALVAADEAMTKRGIDLPVIVSATLSDKSGRTFSGQTLEAFIGSIGGLRTFAAGLNCSLGAAELLDHVRRLAAFSPYPVSFYPNAGLPDELGEYVESPETTARLVGQLAREGCLNLVGGCCGTTPAHIRAIAAAVETIPPRPLKEAASGPLLCGLEPLKPEPGRILAIGEGTNVSGSRSFARFIREGDQRQALAAARKQFASGAQMLDLNVDDGLLDSREEMGAFLRRLGGEPDLCKSPLMLDSSDFDTLIEGLGAIQGKHAVNSLSLKDGEEAFLRKAARLRAYGAAVVVMAFDEAGQADTYERKIEIAGRACRLLMERAGFPPEDIILDLNVLALGTGMEEHRSTAVDFLRGVAWVKGNLPGVLTSGGVSNLSFAFRGHDAIRTALHWVFLSEAEKAGLSMAIVNPATWRREQPPEPELLGLARDLVLNLRSDALDRLLAYAAKSRDGGQAPLKGSAPESLPAWRSLPAPDRLAWALENGLSEYLEQDLSEALETMGPLELLEGPLLDAMGRVGDAFGKGSLFLPQVVQSARVMKEAFALLAPVMQGGAVARTRQKTVLLATVRGDVHDIGKNIVGVVLACNNFRVVDLGVMVLPEDIVARAKAEQADLVGISGLITPSLGEMCAVAEAMEAAGLHIPLMVGGATTSDVYTAVKIAPLYWGGVVRVADASLCAAVASKLTGPEAAVFLAETADAYGRLRGARARQTHERHFYSLAEARARRFRPKGDGFSVPLETGLRSFPRIPLDELAPLIHWPSYLAAWHLPGRLPELYEDPDLGPQARFVMNLAKAYLRHGASEGRLTVRGTAGIYAAWSGQDDLDADDIHVETIRLDGEAGTVGAAGNPDVSVLPMLRRTERKPVEETCLCLSDFVAPERGACGRLGVFAVSVSDPGEDPEAASDPAAPEALAAQLVRHRLAEAASQWLQDQIAGELPEDRRAFIRPAVGFPCLRDHSLKALLLPLAGGEEATGIRLTDSFMMVPEASVLGLYLFHPEALYFDTGRLSREALEEYAERRGLKAEEAAKLLEPFLGE